MLVEDLGGFGVKEVTGEKGLFTFSPSSTFPQTYYTAEALNRGDEQCQTSLHCFFLTPPPQNLFPFSKNNLCVNQRGKRKVMHKDTEQLIN